MHLIKKYYLNIEIPSNYLFIHNYLLIKLNNSYFYSHVFSYENLFASLYKFIQLILTQIVYPLHQSSIQYPLSFIYEETWGIFLKISELIFVLFTVLQVSLKEKHFPYFFRIELLVFKFWKYFVKNWRD